METTKVHSITPITDGYPWDVCRGCNTERPDNEVEGWHVRIRPVEEPDSVGMAATLCPRCREAMAKGYLTFFVNVYLTDRAYGGPEEGGWWFDYGQIEAVYPCDTLKAAISLREWLLENDYTNEGRRPTSSVLSDGEYQITIEFKPGQDWPKRRPHYE